MSLSLLQSCYTVSSCDRKYLLSTTELLTCHYVIVSFSLVQSCCNVSSCDRTLIQFNSSFRPPTINCGMERGSLVSCYFTCSGLGCEFVLESCDNPNTYPYLCDIAVLHQCTFDHIAKVFIHRKQTLCIVKPFCMANLNKGWLNIRLCN